MSPGCLAVQAGFNRQEMLRSTQSLLKGYISRLAWELLGIPQEEFEKVPGENDVLVDLLGQLPVT